MAGAQVPEYSEADLKTMMSGYPEWHPKHERAAGISPEEKSRRRAKNKQRRASRKKNR